MKHKAMLLFIAFGLLGTLSLEAKSSSKVLKNEITALKDELKTTESKMEKSTTELKKSLEDTNKVVAEIKSELATLKSQKPFADTKEIEHILVKYGNNPDGLSTLHYAIKVGDLNAVQLLIDNGADVNAKDGDFTALTRAAAYNQYAISQLLLSLGANVNQVANENKYPHWSTPYALDYAAESGSGELITLLIENGAILDRTRPNEDSHYPRSPLHTASKAGNYQAVVALVKAGAKIDGISPQKNSPAPNGNEKTPLDIAAIELKYIDNPQHLELVKFLVEHEATRRFISYYRNVNGDCNGCVNCPIISGYLESMRK